MAFLKTILTIVAKEIAVEVVSFVKEEFGKIKTDFVQYQLLKAELSIRDQKALELKEDIKQARTQEERDVLLDKMDELLRSSMR